MNVFVKLYPVNRVATTSVLLVLIINKKCFICNDSDACGGIIEATNGTITSPSFPDLYPGNKSCIWEIIAPAQFKITLNFTHFDLEGNNVSQKTFY